MKKEKIKIGMIFLASILLINILSASCCQKTTSGLYCQPIEDDAQCATLDANVPTSCDSTSYCRRGTCINSIEGQCMPNTPEVACNSEEGGVWDERNKEDIPQCQLGCCFLGEGTQFTTQIGCERASSIYSLEVEFRSDITDMIQCFSLANPYTKGACTYVKNYVTKCEMKTKQECYDKEKDTSISEVEFYEGFLCSAPSLGTSCAPSENTICDEDGKVYFVDTCNQKANVYDASKIHDYENYWTYLQEPTCDDGNGNRNSATCGDCDYYLSSTCKESSSAQYGDYICKDLDCVDYSNANEGFTQGRFPKNGESWCASSNGVGLITSTEDENETITISGGDDSSTENLPGSQYYKKMCYDGEVIVEACSDYRQEVCIQSDLDNNEEEEYLNAQCVKRIWEDCYAQNNSEDCLDEEIRDCKWMETGYSFSENGLINKTETEEYAEDDNIPNGVCVPAYAPGFDITSSDSNKNGASICSLGNAVCVVTYTMRGVGNIGELDNLEDMTREEKYELCKQGEKDLLNPSKNCYCLTQKWEDAVNGICTSLGDCGNKNNLLGISGQVTEVVIMSTENITTEE